MARERWLAGLELALLLLLLVAGPLAFGGVHPPARAAALFCAGLILGCRALRRPETTLPDGAGSIVALLAAAVGFALLGLLPLPAGLLRAISPATHQVRQATRALGDGAVPFVASIDPHTTWREALALLGGWGLLCVVLLRRWGRTAAFALAGLVFAVAVGQAAYGVYQVEGRQAEIYGLAKRFYRTQATGSYVNKNHLAGLIELGLPLGVVLLLLPARGSPVLLRLAARALAAAGIGVLSIGLVQSGSRMGLLSLSVGLLGMVVLACFTRRAGVYFLLFLICLAPLVAVNVWTGFAPLRKAFGVLDEEQRRASERIALWSASLELVALHPLLGVGAGNWGTAFASVHPPRLPNRYDEAHNDYLQACVELGPPALVALLASAVLWFRRMVGQARSLPPAERLLAIGITGAVLSLLVHSLADFNLYIPANRRLALVLAGLGLALGPRRQIAPRAGRAWRWLLGGLALLLLWQGGRWLAAERHAPYLPTEHALLPDRGRFEERLAQLDAAGRRGALREALAAADRLLGVQPDDPTWLHERGLLRQMLGSQPGVAPEEVARLRLQALDGFRRAVGGSPWDGRYRLALGLALYAEGRAAAADRQVALARRFGRSSSTLSYRCALYLLNRHAKTRRAELREQALQALRQSCASGLLEDTRRGVALLWRFLPDVRLLERILLPDHVPHGLHYLTRRGRLREALALLQRDPGWRNDADKLLQAGKLHWLIGRRGEAWESWRLAVVLTERTREAWDELETFLGRYREAWPRFLAYIAAQSSPPPEVHYRLAVQARRDGRTALARGFIDHAIRERPKELRYLRFRGELPR